MWKVIYKHKLSGRKVERLIPLGSLYPSYSVMESVGYEIEILEPILKSIQV